MMKLRHLSLPFADFISSSFRCRSASSNLYSGKMSRKCAWISSSILRKMLVTSDGSECARMRLDDWCLYSPSDPGELNIRREFHLIWWDGAEQLLICLLIVS